jgi:hypothetical protein
MGIYNHHVFMIYKTNYYDWRSSMRVNVLFMMVLFCVIGLSIASDGFAAIYKYTDKDGMIYFADDLQSVPVQYRPTARIISGEAKVDEKPSLNQKQQTPLSETGKNELMPAVAQEKSFLETVRKGSFGNRALISAIVVISAIFAFIILRILDADHKKPVVIARVVIVWGVSVFLLYAHAGDVINGFSSMWKRIDNAQQRSEEKGKKAAQAIKKLDTLIEHAEKMASSDPGEAGQERKEEK